MIHADELPSPGVEGDELAKGMSSQSFSRSARALKTTKSSAPYVVRGTPS
jgi:hypothetical protein